MALSLVDKFTLLSGKQIPFLGFGTFRIRGADVIEKCLDAALAAGYRLIDSATVYQNEAEIGAALKKLLPKHKLKREDIFLTSKLGPTQQGYESCIQAVEESLSRLGVDYIDLYLIHWPGTSRLAPDDPTNAAQRRLSWKALESLHASGKIRSLGVSNYTVAHMTQLLEHATVKPSVLQSEFHPHLVQGDVVELCRKNGIFFQAYSSLGTSTADNKLLASTTVIDIAHATAKSPAQVLLRWALQQRIGVIPKSTSGARIAENAKLFDFTLSDEQMTALSALQCGVHYCWNPDGVR